MRSGTPPAGEFSVAARESFRAAAHPESNFWLLAIGNTATKLLLT